MIKIGRHLYVIAFSLYMVAVLVLCLVKTDGLPEIKESFLGLPMDKILHFLMFFPFVILGGFSFINTESKTRHILLILCILTVSGMGIAAGTEQLQAMTGYRTCDINDYYADVAGILTGSIITLLITLRNKSLKKQ